jgi:hypothetical protein
MIGTTLPVFIAVTVVLMGGAGFMMGQALARGWRPVWQVIGYGLLLGLADRFLTFSLFDGVLLTAAGYAIDTAVILVLSLIGYRTTLAAKMVNQYPWLYERVGPFGWRQRGS